MHKWTTSSTQYKCACAVYKDPTYPHFSLRQIKNTKWPLIHKFYTCRYFNEDSILYALLGIVVPLVVSPTVYKLLYSTPVLWVH